MSNCNPLISIIIPIYQIEKLLSKCIESVLNQSFKDFELILVNDGSTDKCLDICKKYKKIDSRIVIINKLNGGLLSARKAGIKVAKCEITAFVDGDDWVDIDFLSSMFRIYELHKVDMVISGFTRAFEGRNQKIPPLFQNGLYSGTDLNKILNSMIKTDVFFQHGITTYVWNKLFRTKILRDILNKIPNQITMGEDAAITYSYLSKCKKIAITNLCNYYYRQRSNSIVKIIQDSNLERKQLENLINHLYNSLKDSVNKSKLKVDLLYYLYSQVLIRFGGGLTNKNINIPFQGLKKNDKVLLFSSGTFGQRIVAHNKKSNFFNLISWIDYDHIESKQIGFKVDSPFTTNNIKSSNYDSLIIASTNNRKNRYILNSLILYGFEIKKYVPINLEINFILKYLKYFGFNLDFYEQ